MQKSNLIRKGRKGFTLVEVALAVAVGLIVIGGAIVGFNAVRENAFNSAARQKVDAAMVIVENIAAANNQIYPTSVANDAAAQSAFSRTWQTQRTTDFNANPWGGALVEADGVIEVPAISFGHTTEALATAATVTAPATGTYTPVTTAVPTDAGARAGTVSYNSAAPGGLWGKQTDISDGSVKVIKGYTVSMFDKLGNAYWYIRSGK
jgi:prepilin-type N-terminal cleavage/methylation domain-containing protein